MPGGKEKKIERTGGSGRVTEKPVITRMVYYKGEGQ